MVVHFCVYVLTAVNTICNPLLSAGGLHGLWETSKVSAFLTTLPLRELDILAIVVTSPLTSLLRYWQLDPNLVYANGPNPWDTAVHEASEEYKHRMVSQVFPFGSETRIAVCSIML